MHHNIIRSELVRFLKINSKKLAYFKNKAKKGIRSVEL